MKLLLLLLSLNWNQGSDTLVVKEPTWLFSTSIGFSVSHSLNLNAPGNTSNNGFAATAALDLGLEYLPVDKRLAATNELHSQFAFFKSDVGSSLVQKTIDETTTLHDWSVGFKKDRKWNVNLIAKTTTGFLKTYENSYLKEVSGIGLQQAFLSPYSVELEPGIKYQPSRAFRVSLSPYSFRLYGVRNQEVLNQGIYIAEVDDNGAFVKHLRETLGASANIWIEKKVKKLFFQYRLGVSSNYLENFFKDGQVNGLFISKWMISKSIALTHRGTLRGQFGSGPFKPNYVQLVQLSFNKSL